MFLPKRIQILTDKYPWLIQFGKYILIGGGTAALELLLFTLLSRVLPIPPANFVATTVATIGNFLVNGRFAFRQVKRIRRSAVLYVILYALNQLFSTLTIGWLVNSFGISASLAKLGTMVCIVLWNFILYRKVVFV